MHAVCKQPTGSRLLIASNLLMQSLAVLLGKQVNKGGRVIWRSAALEPPYTPMIAAAGFKVGARTRGHWRGIRTRDGNGLEFSSQPLAGQAHLQHRRRLHGQGQHVLIILRCGKTLVCLFLFLVSSKSQALLAILILVWVRSAPRYWLGQWTTS